MEIFLLSVLIIGITLVSMTLDKILQELKYQTTLKEEEVELTSDLIKEIKNKHEG